MNLARTVSVDPKEKKEKKKKKKGCVFPSIGGFVAMFGGRKDYMTSQLN